MAATVNQIITGEYDHTGIASIYCDTDSVDSKSVIRTSRGDLTIEDLFLKGEFYWSESEKEYSKNNQIKIAHCSTTRNLTYVNYNYIYRHKVTKKRYKIKSANSKEVIVTEDHSIMVLENDILIEKRPAGLLINDTIITLNNNISNVEITTIDSIEELTPFEDEYVYDIGVNSEDPFFFANDLLVHNSNYFSAWPVIKDEVENGSMEWNNEVAIQLYDNIADQINETFPTFMEQATHTPRSRGEVIRCGREIVASKGIFITKKRYAVMMIDKDGKRLDKNGSPGKVKAMGLDLKRSDTPKVVQDFLSKILENTLNNATKEEIVNQIREFKQKFIELQPWEKGTPKRVNKLTFYTNMYESGKKIMIPGHVMASINWNKLKKMNGDNYSRQIIDGMKTIVCKLKQNPLGVNSVAYPIDETNIPQWFKELPFDDNEMEARIVDKKVENVLGVLNWDLSSETDVKSTFNSLFSFD